MNKAKFYLAACLIGILLLGACGPKKTVSSHYTSETECLGAELDGSQTLRAWGTGKNKSDAVEQARKNAVRDVIFNGVRKGTNDCSLKALLLEANAKEKYEDYFNTFFKDDGTYKLFVGNEDTPVRSDISSSNKSQDKYGVVVRVYRSKLKDRLINDGIIKQ